MSRDVFICDAVRTPIGRFGGALAGVRADDRQRFRSRRCSNATPVSTRRRSMKSSWVAPTGRRGQPQCRTHGRAACRAAGDGSGRDAQPSLRLRYGRGGHRFRTIACGELELAIAGGVESMSRAPYVMGKADSAFGRSQKIEHDHRLALYQPEDEGHVWRGCHAADRRQRRRRVGHQPRGSGRLCPAASSAPLPRSKPVSLPKRSSRW